MNNAAAAKKIFFILQFFYCLREMNNSFYTTIGRNIKCKTLYISSLSPESFWMNNFVLAGLLTYTLFIAFPYNYSGMKNEQIQVFTATGIVLEFHQASLLIPIFGNHYKTKVMV